MNFIGSKIIETERLLMRPTIESDLKVLWKLLCIPQINQYYLTCKLSFDWEKERPWQYKKLKEANNLDKFQWSIVLKKTSECIGQISVHEAHDEDKSVDDKAIRGIGWFIDPRYHRQGLATECANSIIKYMFEEVAITEIRTSAAIENVASWRLMEKLGFIRQKEISKTKYTFLEKEKKCYTYKITKDEYKKREKVQ